jgi:hypothetical protein
MRTFTLYHKGKKYNLYTKYNYEVMRSIPEAGIKKGDDLYQKYINEDLILSKQEYYPEYYTPEEKLTFLKGRSNNLNKLIEKFDLELC